MSLIDWPNLAANAVWITALALALLTVGDAFWEGGLRGAFHRLKAARYQKRLALCGALFCFGVGAAVSSTIESLLWLALGLAFLVQAWGNAKEAR